MKESRILPIVEPIEEINPAVLSASGHWGETQVIQSIKEATLRRKDPQRVLTGKATQPIGGVFHPVSMEYGRLVLQKRSRMKRLKRFLSYLTA